MLSTIGQHSVNHNELSNETLDLVMEAYTYLIHPSTFQFYQPFLAPTLSVNNISL